MFKAIKARKDIGKEKQKLPKVMKSRKEEIERDHVSVSRKKQVY